jgi:hypothetical protein
MPPHTGTYNAAGGIISGPGSPAQEPAARAGVAQGSGHHPWRCGTPTAPTASPASAPARSGWRFRPERRARARPPHSRGSKREPQREPDRGRVVGIALRSNRINANG